MANSERYRIVPDHVVVSDIPRAMLVDRNTERTGEHL